MYAVFVVLSLLKKKSTSAQLRPCQPMFCRLLQKSCFFYFQMVFFISYHKNPRKTTYQAQIYHPSHPSHYYSLRTRKLCLPIRAGNGISRKQRPKKYCKHYNITILIWFIFQFFATFFAFFFCFYAERELIFDLNTCFARLNCFKVDKMKERLSKPKTGAAG